jgi:hypothetical protein
MKFTNCLKNQWKKRFDGNKILTAPSVLKMYKDASNREALPNVKDFKNWKIEALPNIRNLETSRT